jgi:hypothetical protein
MILKAAPRLMFIPAALILLLFEEMAATGFKLAPIVP